MNKHDFRVKAEKKLSALDKEYIIDSDRKIYENLILLPAFLSAQRVFIYYSIGREVDTQRVMDFCASRSVPFLLPRTYPGGRMDFCIVTDLSALVVKPPYNICEPPDDAPTAKPTERDVIIVPALCFDEGHARLGHGAGYYDRFLADCPAFLIGLCREALVFEQIPRDTHDISVDCLITEIKVRNR